MSHTDTVLCALLFVLTLPGIKLLRCERARRARCEDSSYQLALFLLYPGVVAL